MALFGILQLPKCADFNTVLSSGICYIRNVIDCLVFSAPSCICLDNISAKPLRKELRRAENDVSVFGAVQNIVETHATYAIRVRQNGE